MIKPQRTSNKYILQISSLPYLGNPFNNEKLVIYRKQLDYILKDIEPNDKKYLYEVENFFVLKNNKLTTINPKYISFLDELLINSPTIAISDIVSQLATIDLLVRIMAAKAHDQVPGLKLNSMVASISSLLTQIKLTDSHLGLKFTYPWLNETLTLLQKNDYFGLQRLIIAKKWQVLDSLSFNNLFNFEAIVIYLLRWYLIDFFITAANHELVAPKIYNMIQGGNEKNEAAE